MHCYFFFACFGFVFFNVPIKKFSVILGRVFTSTLESLKCLAQGHYTAVVGIEPWISRPRVRRSTTKPPRPPNYLLVTARSGKYHALFEEILQTAAVTHVPKMHSRLWFHALPEVYPAFISSFWLLVSLLLFKQNLFSNFTL